MSSPSQDGPPASASLASRSSAIRVKRATTVSRPNPTPAPAAAGSPTNDGQAATQADASMPQEAGASSPTRRVEIAAPSQTSSSGSGPDSAPPVRGRKRGDSISQRLQRSFEASNGLQPSSSTEGARRPRAFTTLATIPSHMEIPSTTDEALPRSAAEDTQTPGDQLPERRQSVASRRRSGSLARSSGQYERPVTPPQTVRVRVGSLRGRRSQDERPSIASERPVVTDEKGEAAAAAQTRPRAFTVGGALGRMRAGTFLPSMTTAKEDTDGTQGDDEDDHHEADEVDLLEVIDPAVGTAATLSQIQSAIFLPPNLGLPFRRPVVDLGEAPSAASARRRRATTVAAPRPSTAPQPGEQPPVAVGDAAAADALTTVDGESISESEALDEHLKDLVRRKGKKREMLERVWHGFVAFAKTPLGVCVCIYGFLVVFWGAALVLILIHAISFSNYHTYQIWIEICSQILNGLFTVTGIGLFPFRLIDWWHAGTILHYAKLTWRRRAKLHLEPLEDPNDLPDEEYEPETTAAASSNPKEGYASTSSPTGSHESKQTPRAGKDLAAEEATVGLGRVEPRARSGTAATVMTKSLAPEANVEHEPLHMCSVVLTPKELARLRHAQSKLCKSQTWYRPHASHTHQAFPIKWMVIILTLNVGNSVFQAMLCGVMWGLTYTTRPAWTTGCLIPCSFLCGIFSGVFIWRIGKRTQKQKEVIEHVEEALEDEKRIE